MDKPQIPDVGTPLTKQEYADLVQQVLEYMGAALDASQAAGHDPHPSNLANLERSRKTLLKDRWKGGPFSSDARMRLLCGLSSADYCKPPAAAPMPATPGDMPVNAHITHETIRYNPSQIAGPGA